MGEVRRRARAAAEKRRTLGAGSGQKLGGAPIMRGTNIREVIADATQRRTTVTKGCASGTDEGQKLAEEASRNGFKTKAEEDDANEQAIIQAYIEMIQEEEREKYGSSYVPPSNANPAGPRSTFSPPVIPESTTPEMVPQTQRLCSDPVLVDLSNDDDESYSSTWACPICTLLNPTTFLCCDACGSERPQPEHKTSSNPAPNRAPDSLKRHPDAHNSLKPRSKAIQSLLELEKKAPKRPVGWVCHFCGTFMETEWWTCATCGTMKQTS